MNFYKHETAIVEDHGSLSNNVKVWAFCQIRKGAKLLDHVSVGKGSFVDEGVTVGVGTRIQNSVNIYSGVKIGSWCFVGPMVVFTNDQSPRVGNKSWTKVETVLNNCCSIGAGAVIRCGVKLGAFSMVGAGAVVTKDIEPFSLAIGVPAVEKSKICACGHLRLDLETSYEDLINECCKKNMSEETFELARIEINRLKESGYSLNKREML